MAGVDIDLYSRRREEEEAQEISCRCELIHSVLITNDSLSTRHQILNIQQLEGA